MLPITEQENPETENIDKISTIEALRLINAEDAKVADAVQLALPEIALTVDSVAERLQNGGRLFYVGSGTSGRLGVLDASEIPPTFGVSYELVQGVIAGGYEALYKATESSEDSKNAGADDLSSRGLTKNDAVIGIAASGSTPYTIGAVEFARGVGCFTASVTCAFDSELSRAAHVSIEAVVGAEAITGSTRMKAGTAQKMILNMISTMTMVRLGYVKGNRMINVKSSNQKLKDRSLRILRAETGLNEFALRILFKSAGEDLRVALVMHESGTKRGPAAEALQKSNYVVDRAVELLKN
ncbi:MAG: N-acetylmuramic acid 6-phosphate etherase [Pyrinomonadaceae bacterium]|nr:N-acetylmuramic acid 6-phosphate etherase [Pyrinomonadaceae bacterium]